MSTNGDSSAPQVRIRLATNNPRYALADSAPILVPTSFRRLALSSLVNNLLGHDQAVPFDFIIRGTYLRTTLEEYLTEIGTSSETVIEAEYTPAQKPPRYVASFQHDDWVSAVDVLSGAQTSHGNPRILSASYDGHLRVWNTSSQVLATSPAKSAGGHSSFVKDAKFVSYTHLASAGFDRVLRVWKYDEEADALSATITPHLELYGHTSCIDSIATHAPTHRLLTASADHSIGLWSTRKSDAPAAPDDLVPKTVRENGKRRKLNPPVSVSQRGPLSMLRQHTQQVSGVIFDSKDSTVAYSTSWDQTMRTWDLVTSSVVDTRTTNQALFAVEQMPELHLVATGTAGRDIKLIDPRASAAAVTVMTLRGHKNSVVALARDPRNGHSLVSGSHDGTCRIWDLRNTKQGTDGITVQSLHTLVRESMKGPTPEVASGAQVYGVYWSADLGILSAGQDKNIQINSSERP
jgi:ribosome biogenesis protein